VSELDPIEVAARLAEAARLFDPPHVDDLREPVPPPDLSPETVQARLDELRALLRLAEHLGRARFRG
jgi:hypothetical protein